MSITSSKCEKMDFEWNILTFGLGFSQILMIQSKLPIFWPQKCGSYTNRNLFTHKSEKINATRCV